MMIRNATRCVLVAPVLEVTSLHPNVLSLVAQLQKILPCFYMSTSNAFFVKK